MCRRTLLCDGNLQETEMNKLDSSIALSSKLKKNIILTISSIICKSYGPDSLMTLMGTATGRVLTTNNGMVILETLHLSHPFAKVIVQALKKQYVHTADGVETFLLYLSQSVIELEKMVTISGRYGEHFGNKISLQLRKIENDVLPILYSELYSVSVTKTELTLTAKDLTSTLNTNISSHLSRRNTITLVDLLLRTLAIPNEEVSLVGVQRNVQFMIENFTFLHFKLPRTLLQNSTTLKGFLIRRDFSYKCIRLEEISNCKFVLLRCSIEGVTIGDPSEIVYLKDEISVSKSFMCRIDAASTYLKLLKKLQISVIICSEKVPDFVLTLCRESEISVVSCVEEEDIEFLGRISSVQAVSSPFDPVEENNIGVWSSCTRKLLGSQRNVHIQFPSYIQSKIPEMLILASPTEGSVDQLADVAFKAYKSLEMCFAFQLSINSSTFATRTTCNTDAQGGNNQCTKIGDDTCPKSMTSVDHSEKPSDNNVAKMSGNVCESLENDANKKPHFEESSGCHKGNHKVFADAQARYLKHTESFPEYDFKDTCQKENLGSECPMFVAVGGGGFFEMKTAELLKTYSQDFTDEHIGLGCKILHDSLLSVPRTLHKQLSTNRTSESRDYMEKLQQMNMSMKEGCVCGFDKRGRVCDVIQTGILEPLASKISTLASVIQLLQQILRIDSIVSVGHLPEFNHDSSDDEER